MVFTMPTKPSFQFISLADLNAVIGGCGKKQPPPQPQPQQCCPQPPAGGPEIATSVQISGYGGAQ